MRLTIFWVFKKVILKKSVYYVIDLIFFSRFENLPKKVGTITTNGIKINKVGANYNYINYNYFLKIFLADVVTPKKTYS